MKKIFYLIFLQIGICKIGISQCDIAHNGLGAFPSPIAVGQTSVFTFSISNQGTETSCEYGVTPVPPETNPDIRVTFSLPATGYVFDGFVYPAPTSATTASGPYFNWSYNPSTRVITGRNNRTIPWQEGEVDIKIRVKGTAPSFNSSNLNIQVLNGASNINTGNDAVSASLRVTGLSVTATPTQIICGATTGSVSINLPTGGTSPFSISGPGITGSVSVPTANFPYIVTNVPAGTHTYTVTDVNSNSGTAQVIINPAPIVPNASVSPSSFVLDCNTPSKELIASGGGTYLWSANAGSATTSNITVTAAGTYTVTVTGSNGCTAQATATITKTLDTELPKIVNCPSTVNVSTGASSTDCFAIATWTEPTATDNCTLPANLVWTKSHNPGASFAVGTTVVTYTAKDEANNVSLACTFNVVVEDNTAPVIADCPASTITVNSATAPNCNALVTLPNITATDNCTVPTAITVNWELSDATTGTGTGALPTQFNVGTTHVFITFEDAALNSSICEFDVIVDKITPTFTQVSPICAGASLAALPTTSNNGVVGTWAPSINNLATTTYTFTPTNPSCANSTTMQIVVNPLPTVTTGTYGPACENEANISLLGTPADGTWSGTGVSGSVGSFVFDPSLGSQTLNYSYTDGNGCSNSASTAITVNKNPILGTVTAAPVCEGNAATINLTGLLPSVSGVATYTLSSTGATEYTQTGTADGSGNLSFNTPVLTFAENGLIVTITKLKVDGTNCETSFTGKTVTLDVNKNVPTPTVTAGASPICIGATSTFTTTGTGGVWSSSDPTVATVSNASGTEGQVTGLMAGSTDITYTISTGCGTPVSDKKSITVSPNVPTPTVTAGTSPICIGATSTFTTTGTGGVWSSSDPTIATVSNASGTEGQVTGLMAGSTDITYTISTGCGTPVSDKKSITVSPNVPTPTVTAGTSPICIGSTSTFTTTGTGGVWSSSDPTVATVSNASGTEGQVTGLMAGSTDITYTISTGCGTPVSDKKSITVSPNVPTPTVTAGTSPICIGATSTFTTTGTGGVWSSSDPTIATVSNASGTEGQVTGLMVGSTDITYTISTGCGTPVSDKKSITVSPNVPTPTVTAGTSPICIGATSTFTTTGTGGVWSSSDPTVATVSNASGTEGQVTGLMAGSTDITYTISTGCGTPVSDKKSITVSPNVPTPTVTAGTSPICIGSTSTFTTTGTGGVWSSSDPTVATVSNASGTEGQVTGLMAGSTDITYTISTGCGTPVSDKKSITVSPNVPTPTVTAGTSPICIGSTSTFTTTGTGGVWSSSDPIVATVSNASGTEGQVTGLMAGSTDITYTISTGCGTPVSDKKSITVSPNVPTPTVTAGTSPICIGATSTFTTTGTGGVWSSSDPTIATVSNASGTEGQVTGLMVGSTDITYTISTGCGTPVSDKKSITVSPNVPTPTVTAGTSPICIGATSTFTTTGTGGVWSSSDPTVATVSNASGTEGQVTGLMAGSTDITYTISTGCGTPVSDKKSITVSPNVPTPTVTAGTSPICIGSTSTFTTTGTGGVWSSSDPTVATVSNASGTEGQVTGLMAGSTDITYTISTGCGTPVSDKKSITVNANSANTTSITACDSYTWVNTGQTYTSSGIYTGTTTNCVTEKLNLTITQTITPTFTQVAPICEGGVLAPLPTTSNNGVEGSWSPTINNMATTTYTFTPTAGQCANSATMEIVVNQPPTPTITNNSNTTILTCLQTSISLTATGGTSYSWSDGATVLGTNDMLTISSAGTYTVTVTATNGCTASTSVVITYAPDTEKPQITCPVVSTIEGCSTDAITVLTYSETEVITSMAGFTTAGGSASDNCGIVKVSYIDTKSTTSCPIVVSRVWTVTDAANLTASCTQIIEIKDNTPPTITLPSPFFDTNPPTTIINDVAVFNTPSTSCDLNVVFNKPILSDNCSLKENIILSVSAKNSMGGSISIFNQVDTFSGNFPLGNNTLTITATDLCGKVSTKQLTIRIVDTIKPVKPTLPAITGCGAVASPTTIDNCSGVITGTTTNPTEYYVAGSYTITWLFTDESGNTETATQQVTVTGSGVIAGSVVKDITSADNLVNGALQTSVVAHVSLVKGSTIVATVPVTAGLYTLPDVCAGIYNVVLHTTATGSTSPQLPAGYSGFVGEGKLNGAPDVSPNGVAQVTISSGSLVYGNARVAAGGDVSFGLGPQALPVRLISFEGKPTDKGNLLTWSSSAEQNFSHYEVERSTDAKAFVNIGKVATTNGNSKETNSYQYLDSVSGMLPGAANYTNDSYYRLKMVDLDGSSEYSKVIFIKTEKIGNSTVGQFYPNPASSNETSVEINSATNSAWQITTLDLAGRVISTEYRNLEMGKNLVKLRTEKLSPGTNIIRFENNNGVQYRKLIKN